MYLQNPQLVYGYLHTIRLLNSSLYDQFFSYECLDLFKKKNREPQYFDIDLLVVELRLAKRGDFSMFGRNP